MSRRFPLLTQARAAYIIIQKEIFVKSVCCAVNGYIVKDWLGHTGEYAFYSNSAFGVAYSLYIALTQVPSIISAVFKEN